MKRAAILMAVLLIGGVVAWLSFGGLDRVTEDRIEATLVEKGIPQEVAACMAGRMVDRLTINQLRKLERAKAQDGETTVPLSRGEVLDRIRRIDDPEAVEVTATAAALCVIGLG